MKVSRFHRFRGHERPGRPHPLRLEAQPVLALQVLIAFREDVAADATPQRLPRRPLSIATEFLQVDLGVVPLEI